MRHVAVRKLDFYQTGDGLSDSFTVARIEMRAHQKSSVDGFCKIVFAHLAQCFSEIVNDKPVVIREQRVPHLRNFPTREIKKCRRSINAMSSRMVSGIGEKMAGLDAITSIG